MLFIGLLPIFVIVVAVQVFVLVSTGVDPRAMTPPFREDYRFVRKNFETESGLPGSSDLVGRKGG
jgi:hypothetical protein